MKQYNKCVDCIYFKDKTYRTIADGVYLKGCKKLVKGTGSDEYNVFGDTTYVGDKSCFVENNQIRMEIK